MDIAAINISLIARKKELRRNVININLMSCY